MKTKFLGLMALTVAAAAAFTSCNTAPDVAGSWRCNPQNLFVHSAPNQDIKFFAGSIADVVTFTPAANDNKMGTIDINSTIDLSAHAGSVTQQIGPYQTSVAAVASISGTWAYSKDEDNEINVVFDFNSLKISVDPEAVQFVDKFPIAPEQAEIEQLTPQVIAGAKTELLQALTSYYGRYTKLDDVEVDRGALTLELDGVPDNGVKMIYSKIDKE